MDALRIFVSHSNQDKAIADTFVHGLRSAGADVWYDEHNLGAGHLKNEIQRELDRRPIFIVLLSKAAFASGWVKRETDWADDLADRDPTRLILPVTVGPIDQSDFSGETGWLFLHAYRRIEAPGYQPYPVSEAITRTLRLLGLSSQPQPSESAADLTLRQKRLNRLNAVAECARALSAFEAALSLDPTDANAWTGKGNALCGLGRPEEALTAFKRALVLGPKYWTGREDALSGLEKAQEAVAAYGLPMLDPEEPSDWNDMGDALYYLKRYDEALFAFEQDLVLDPTDANAWTGKGFVLNNLKRCEEALAAFEESLAHAPSSSSAWTGKAEALRCLGRAVEADAAERQAKELGT